MYGIQLLKAQLHLSQDLQSNGLPDGVDVKKWDAFSGFVIRSIVC